MAPTRGADRAIGSDRNRSKTPSLMSVLRLTPIEDEKDFTDVVVDLAARGIPVTEIALRLPSLDEVFFTLTGKGVPADVPADLDKEVSV